jgi:hypothetical protein
LRLESNKAFNEITSIQDAIELDKKLRADVSTYFEQKIYRVLVP